jgi:hypothetical protein
MGNCITRNSIHDDNTTTTVVVDNITYHIKGDYSYKKNEK